MKTKEEHIKEEHIKRHQELYNTLSELVADFVADNKGPVLDKSIKVLLDWSYEQTIHMD